MGTDLSAAAGERSVRAPGVTTELASKLFVCHVVPELIPDGSVFAAFHRMNANVKGSMLAKARGAVEQQVKSVLGSDIPSK